MFGREQFIGKREGDFSQSYDKIKQYGSGAYGTVYQVRNKFSGETRACKQLPKSKIADMSQLKLEINIMMKTDHPNIIKFYEYFEDIGYLYLIMEECGGGELFDKITERLEMRKPFTEKEAAGVFKQLMSAVAFCHGQNIVHRDLKPENILLQTKFIDSPIKVIDFGLSKIFKNSDHTMFNKCGTPYYIAPEVLNGYYDEKCDIWSAGVILYILLSGEPPFNGYTDEEIYRKILSKKFSFPSPKWDNISYDAKNLLTAIFTNNYSRPSAEQVLAHKWVSSLAPNSSESIVYFNTENLASYSKISKVKKAVLTFIASRLKDDDIKRLKDLFLYLDKNGDGILSYNDINSACTTVNVNLNFQEIFKLLDTDGSGFVNYTEFLAATIDKKTYLKQEKLFEAFKSFDKDGSGKISLNEIASVLNAGPEDMKYLEYDLKRFDLNRDGEIDFNEFCLMMENQ